MEAHLYFTHSPEPEERIVYPEVPPKSFDSPDVPDTYLQEFNEAAAVLRVSAKASAALSRRILQRLLKEHLNLSNNSLAAQIRDFIKLPGVPSYLVEAVDAIRNIGNIAAYPQKDKNTGAIVDVEPGEAEWILEVIEQLFDFIFIQPKKLEENKHRLNEKLKEIGKPPMDEK